MIRTQRLLAVSSFISAVLFSGNLFGQTLVDTVFTTGFDGWTDTFSGSPVAGGQPNWGVLLTGPKTLSESSDGRAADGSTSEGLGDGMFTPYVLVNTADETPATYNLSARMGTYDDDGFGLVFGYQDLDNYFRVGWRLQSSGSLGFEEGVAVQKIVDGVITQLGTGPSLFPSGDGSLSDVDVDVDGANWTISVDGNEVLSGSDADLQPGSYGVQSWAQREGGPGDRYYGTAVESIAVSSSVLNKTTTFADAIPVNWRPLMMTNAEGNQGTGVDDFGNFRQDFRDGTIRDDTNGYEWATPTAPNVDFIGPGVVLDEPGSDDLTNYEMNVRMESGDNDGIGLLLRATGEESFYRINFAAEPMDSEGERAPQGMSIQKFDNGIWSELYRDDQDDPSFVYSHEVPFDVRVAATGNSIKVWVVDDPDGAATTINYPAVIDSSDPLLSGSVGFTNWGNGTIDNGVVYSAYGGGGTSFLVAVPEPGTVILLSLAGGLLLAGRRYSNT
ncbi:PEP-CTERM sorting domain-containing protein [Aeoliella sp. ICT_H6.2]|uniref:PEP-CTERM sorting domain-containing protein n=1 Tax=Aeoliella straminimaris TaxID=2954799 RepID=A0A9X2FC40_9BACT|nr:PEP-CTERM sorting domain-containing protein [Aeoliella straminimaris]MCO6046185.1 PEP-CTERM sorting domain-containing protein [Aeoliella straminimaris]